LKIEKQIFYGTFNEICEKMINKGGSLRDLVISKILKKTNNPKVQ